MKQVVCALAVVAGVFGPLCALADEGQTTSGYSVIPENDGLTFHFVNRSYDWTSIWDPDSGEAKHLLLMETEDRTVSNAVDGTLNSAVTVEVSQVGLDGKVEPLYRISDPGEVGEIRWIAFDQAYYQATTYGCCGAFNSSRTYSLRSGQKLFSHTVPPAWFEVPNAGGLVRLVGVHTIYSMDDFEVFGERSDALALVTLATPTEPVEAFLIAVDGTLSSEELEYPDASVGWAEPGEPPAPEMTVWTADGQRDISKIEGLKLVIGFPPELRIEVPMVAGHLDIANAIVPKGLRLEPQPVEVP